MGNKHSCHSCISCFDGKKATPKPKGKLPENDLMTNLVLPDFFIHLPRDLFYSILLRFSFENLCQLCCVSKHWNSIINSRSFNMAWQYANLGTRPADYKGSILYSCIRLKETESYIFYRRRWNGQFAPHQHHRHPSLVIDCWSAPLRGGVDDNRHFLVGSTSRDGLLCIVSRSKHIDCNCIFIWNPYTQERRRISWPDNGWLRSFVGFAYDSDTRICDHKIIFIGYCSYQRKWRATTRGLRSNQWNTVDAFKSSAPCACSFKARPEFQSVAVASHVYWIGEHIDIDGIYFILKFSLKKEKLTTVFLPEGREASAKADLDNFLRLGECRGSLYLFSSTAHLIKVWMHLEKLEDDGTGITWVKVLCVCSSVHRTMEPLGFSQHGELVLRVGNKLFSYVKRKSRLTILVDDIRPTKDKYYPLHSNLRFLETESSISP